MIISGDKHTSLLCRCVGDEESFKTSAPTSDRLGQFVERPAAVVRLSADDDNAVLKFYVDDDGQLRHVDYDNDDDVDDDDDANDDDDDESDWELLPPHQAPMTPPPPPPPTTPTPTDSSSGDDKYQQHYVRILKLVDLYSIH